jgi:peptidoglycan-associated lipoprotein
MTTRQLLRILAPVALLLAVAGCGPKYPACEKDDHCQEGEYCVNNLCQQCRDDGDCAAGESCHDGACKPPGYCAENADCGSGQVCRDNLCGPCMSSDDCGPDGACVNGACIDAECQTDQDCPAGLACVGRICVPQQQPVAAALDHDCVLQPVYFDFDSSHIDDETRRVLQHNYECLLAAQERVTLEGHCDPRGTTEYNMALGDRRARRTKKVLKAMSVDPKRLKTRSKGEEEARGTGPSGWSEDRRVDFE